MYLYIFFSTQGLKTATYFWVGSYIKIHGVQPDYWFPFSNEPLFKDRVDTVVDWFKNKSVIMATLYFQEPDLTGHRFGPDSPEMEAKLQEMDGILGYLMSKLKDNGLYDEVNVIVTSDHGMTAVDPINRVRKSFEEGNGVLPITQNHNS